MAFYIYKDGIGGRYLMASINLGRVGFVPKGEYVPATTYVKYDVVSYNGSNYVA